MIERNYRIILLKSGSKTFRTKSIIILVDLFTTVEIYGKKFIIDQFRVFESD